MQARRIRYESGTKGEIMKLLLNNGALMYDPLSIKGSVKAKTIRNAIDEMQKAGLVEKHLSEMGQYITITNEEMINRYCCRYKRNGMWDSYVVDEELLKHWKERSREDAMQIVKYQKVLKRDTNYRSLKRINDIARREYLKAEAKQVMYLSDVITLVNEDKGKEIEKGVFYDGLEVKADTSYRVLTKDEIEDVMVANSRAVGNLISLGGTYTIYNTGKNLLRWNALLSEESFNNACRNIAKERHGIIADKRQAIILGHKFKPLVSLIERNDRTEEGRKANKIMESFYDDIFYIPIGEAGGKVLTLMQQDYWFDIMKEYLIPQDYDTEPLHIGRGADGMKADNVILLFTAGNVKQLEVFEQRAILNPNSKFTLKSFSFMKDALEKVTWPNNVSLEYEDIDEYMELLRQEGLL